MADEYLKSIIAALLEEVRLLTVPIKANALKRFQADFLTTDMRRQAYAAFDGDRSIQQISADIDCKPNTLQVFVQTLVAEDLVDVETRGKSQIIRKSMSKIAVYYADKDLKEEGN